MTINERINYAFKEVYGRKFNKNKPGDILDLDALAYILGKNGVNISGRFYFHFNLDENNQIVSNKFNDYVINNLFEGDNHLLYTAEKDIIARIKRLVKPEIVRNVAKIEYIVNKKGYMSEKTIKEYFVKNFGTAKEFKEAYEAYQNYNLKAAGKIISQGKLVSKANSSKDDGLSL